MVFLIKSCINFQATLQDNENERVRRATRLNFGNTRFILRPVSATSSSNSRGGSLRLVMNNGGTGNGSNGSNRNRVTVALKPSGK